MTDADFRVLFARVEEPFEPRPEFVARLLCDIDAVAAPSGAVPGNGAGSHHATADLSGTLPERAYLPEPEAQPTSTPGRARARRNRITVGLATAAVIATAVVVVTRSTGSHGPGLSPNPPLSPATTVSPVTTAPPATTQAPGTSLSSTNNPWPFGGCQGLYLTPNIWPNLPPGFADGQVVHVVLKGCPPGGTYLAAECRGGLGDCLHQSGIADATGTVSIYLKMQKVISGVYCGIEGGCSFGVFRPEGNATSAFPLGYSYSNQHIWFGP